MNNSLKDKFLYFCNAENEEDYFSKTLIYLCESNSEGSFGIIINRTVEIRLKDFFSFEHQKPYWQSCRERIRKLWNIPVRQEYIKKSKHKLNKKEV